MGQLIKLQDYVSRYEQNIFVYPSRFVQLKIQQWDKLRARWENGELLLQNQREEQYEEDWEEEGNHFLISHMKKLLNFKRKKEEEMDEEEEERGEEENESIFTFTPKFTTIPETEEDLKKLFLEQLFVHQMKWASTTLTEKSIVDRSFYFNEQLKYFLQRFPDTFLVLYSPIFRIKKAPVELETILLTPTDIWCISFIEHEDLAVFQGSKEHFWLKKINKRDEKVLNPLIALNRTGAIVNDILQLVDISLPIRKIVLSRNGYIDYFGQPYDIEFIDRRNYEKWFQFMRGQRTPFKYIQFKAAESLLEFCDTTSIRRLEWEID